MAPSGGSQHGSLHAQRVGHAHGVGIAVFPFVGHVDDTMRHHLWRVFPRIENVYTAKPDAVHPQQVFTNTLLGDVTVHPVPPHTGLRGLWRSDKSRFERVILRLDAHRKGHQRSQQQKSANLHRVRILSFHVSSAKIGFTSAIQSKLYCVLPYTISCKDSIFLPKSPFSMTIILYPISLFLHNRPRLYHRCAS